MEAQSCAGKWPRRSDLDTNESLAAGDLEAHGLRRDIFNTTRSGKELAWVKIDHKFHWDRLIEPHSDAAYRLYVGGLCYCNWQETDGYIDAGQLHLIRQRMGGARFRLAVGQLEAAG